MNSEPMTLKEIAEIEGISKQRVAEIIESALKKVRKAMNERNIKIEDLL